MQEAGGDWPLLLGTRGGCSGGEFRALEPSFLFAQFLCSLPSESPAQMEIECHSHGLRNIPLTPAQQWHWHKGTDFLPQRADSTDKQGRLAASPRAFILRACKIHSRRSGNPGACPQTRAFQSGPCTPRRRSQNIPCSEHLWELLAPFSGRVSLRKLVFRSMEHSQLLSLAGKPVLGF